MEGFLATEEQTWNKVPNIAPNEVI